MNKKPKTKTEVILNYLDFAVQTILLLVVVFFLANPPEVQMGNNLNSPKINNLSDLFKELMIQGSLRLFFVILNTTVSLIFMILPLILWWIYQLISAILLGLIFKNLYYVVYSLVFIGLILILFFIQPEALPKFINNGIIIIFFTFPFFYYLNRLYVAIWVR